MVMSRSLDDIKTVILELIPEDGATIGNHSLLAAIQKRTPAVTESEYQAARDALIEEGELARGRGRGGSVYRIVENEEEPADEDDADADEGQADDDFTLEVQDEPARVSSKKVRAKSRKRSRSDAPPQVLSYRHPDKRANNPEVGMVHPDNDPEQPKTVWKYDPHLDPALQFDSPRARIENLIDRALASGNAEQMREALAELKRLQEPYLTWTGKAERTSFDVDTVSLHVHERIDPASILAVVRNRLKAETASAEGPFQPGLFDAPFESLPLRQALDFYKHEKNWSNRLIAGNSLLVMNSLLQKESMAGQVQMIYIDPPYGIKYGSNFQPFTNKRDVKDGSDADLTQEPEMIKAFRDTWELGIHSYLTYLRDRLILVKDLLHDSGSVFVQISDENVHLVRQVLDEVFGVKNFCADVVFTKTTGLSTKMLDDRFDYIIWYAKDANKVKYRQLYLEKKVEAKGAGWFARFVNGWSRGLTKDELRTGSPPPGARAYRPGDISSQGNPQFPFPYMGREYTKEWKTTANGLTRLSYSGRLHVSEDSIRYIRYLDDFPAISVNSLWDDTATGNFTDQKIYVVQTGSKAVERCVMMTTDPGDLVFDPTCGSGTTAVAAEKWGRRWVTCDTSRIAVTLAKQRLMTASFDYYALRYPHEGLRAGFIYKTVPHVTLKSIANNPDIDAIYERMHPAIEAVLAELNKHLKGTPAFTPAQGARRATKVAIGKGEVLEEWEVPFDWPQDWPEHAKAHFEAFQAARQAMQKAMDRSIADHAEPEPLYDKPEPDPNKLRISGPFTVEAVPNPTVMALDEAKPPTEADTAVARSGETSRQTRWRDELMKTGIRGKGGQMLKFAELETIPGLRYLHASATLADTGDRVLVSFGPEHAALEQKQVELALSEAEKLRPAPKIIVFCSFAFDPEAAKDIDEVQWAGVTLLKAQMNTDLLTEDLRKARASNESFWLMGQPDVELHALTDGRWQIEVHGFDYFDTTKGELVSGGKSKIAMWSLDTDYDRRSLFPHQIFFPIAGKKEGWQRLRKTIKAELDEGLLDQFHGTLSLPFKTGDNRCVAVKIVDDRGIESLKIIPLNG